MNDTPAPAPVPSPTTDVRPGAERWHWARRHAGELVRFGLGSTLPWGFGWLDDDGRPMAVDAGATQYDLRAWIHCRMTHVFALQRLVDPGVVPANRLDEAIDLGVRGLNSVMRDRLHDGWFDAVRVGIAPSGRTVPSEAASDAGVTPLHTEKVAYEHSFVVLAAASATGAGHPDARSLLAQSLAIFERFIDPVQPPMRTDVMARDWSSTPAYRGMNANMHAVEALCAASDVTGDERWREQALQIAAFAIDGVARAHQWRLPEHFDERWTALPDYNRDRPGDQFRPYGVTIGHLLEWARLLLHLRAADPQRAPAWLLPAARALFDTAVRDGWHADGADGFIYTTDFDGRPVMSTRLYWVVSEAIATAWSLHLVTAEPHYLVLHDQWVEHVRAHWIDGRRGGWHAELDAQLRPSPGVWVGKSDIYHAWQAVIMPSLCRTPDTVATLPTSFVAAARALAAAAVPDHGRHGHAGT